MAGHGYARKGYVGYDEVEQPSYRGYVCNDHVCRPVLIDGEGRKKPIISYTTNHSTPAYSYSSAPEVETFKDLEKWQRQSLSISPLRDRPQGQFNEVITTVKTEVSQPTNYWQTTTPPASHDYYGHDGNNTYSAWNKATKAKPISSHPLTTTTNDIGEAVDFLRHAINVAEPQVWASSQMPFGIQKRETYTETIDSSEAARRYARPTFKQQPAVQTDCRGSIDSREALRRYNGMIVP